MTQNICPKCGGSGKINFYSHVRGGVCFRCKGSGDHTMPGMLAPTFSKFQMPIDPEYAARQDAHEAEAEAILGRTNLTVGEIEAATGRTMDWF